MRSDQGIREAEVPKSTRCRGLREAWEPTAGDPLGEEGSVPRGGPHCGVAGAAVCWQVPGTPGITLPNWSKVKPSISVLPL